MGMYPDAEPRARCPCASANATVRSEPERRFLAARLAEV